MHPSGLVGNYVTVLLQITSVSVCRKLSKYNAVGQSYCKKNKRVQFFCPTVYISYLCNARTMKKQVIYYKLIALDQINSLYLSVMDLFILITVPEFSLF